MTAGEEYITLPNFLIPYRNGGVEDYTEEPETVGKIVLAVASKLFRNADISANLSPCERGVYRHWLKVAEDGLEKASRASEKGKNAVNTRWNNRRAQQAANLSPSEPVGGRSPEPAPVPVAGKPPAPVPEPVRQIGTAQGTPQAQAARLPAPVPARSPAPRPLPRPNPSGGERRGGAVQIGECFGNLSALLGGGFGGGIADRINAEPVKTALEITGETGNKLAENTLKKYLRTKGEAGFIDTLFAFNSEIKNGEEVGNRGAALNARLKALPDIPAGRCAK